MICPMPWMYEVAHDGDLPKALPKDVENRTWFTEYTGPLLIHASKKYDLNAPIIPGMAAKCPRGCIIGKVNLDFCQFDSQSEWHVEGYYGWYLSGSKTLRTPIPYIGQLKLFDVPFSIKMEAFYD
jgi:hypothetical protein